MILSVGQWDSSLFAQNMKTDRKNIKREARIEKR
jgi:hypothetical protein